MIGNPNVRDFSMPNLSVKFTWQSYTPSTTPYLLDPLVVDPRKDLLLPFEHHGPQHLLLFPGDIVKLSTTAQQQSAKTTAPLIGVGGVASVTVPDEAASSEAKDPGKGLHLLSEYGKAPPKTQETQARLPFRAPALQQNLAAGSHPLESTLGVAYQVQPRANLEHTFDSTASQTAGKADYSILYRTLETGGTSSVTTTATLWDRLVESSATLSVDALWRSRFDPSSSELALPNTDPNYWPNLLLGDALQDKIALRTLLVDTLRPIPLHTGALGLESPVPAGRAALPDQLRRHRSVESRVRPHPVLLDARCRLGAHPAVCPWS